MAPVRALLNAGIGVCDMVASGLQVCAGCGGGGCVGCEWETNRSYA
jgi:hypothetical protein